MAWEKFQLKFLLMFGFFRPNTTHAGADTRQSLRRCVSVEEVEQAHARVLKNGQAYIPPLFVANTLVQMYAKFGNAISASQAFSQIPMSHRDVVDWTTLISCCTSGGFPEASLSLLQIMKAQGIAPDEVTMVAAFSACAKLQNVDTGQEAHQSLIKTGIPFSEHAFNAAMHMYAECDRMEETCCLFHEMILDKSLIGCPTVVSWTIIFRAILRLEGIVNARELFDKMPERNEVAWTGMISAYVNEGNSKEALALIAQVICLPSACKLNSASICSILSACAQSGDLIVGRLVHVYITKVGENDQPTVPTALLDMYAKCGRVDIARNIFDAMPCRNVVTWNAMLSGLAMHGRSSETIELFSLMTSGSAYPPLVPDDVTFVAVLSACSHTGLLEQGKHYFHALQSVYRIEPKMEHYACMVDLLGRFGMLYEAELLVREMPFPPNEVVLSSLLGSCAVHENIELVERILTERNWVCSLIQSEALVSNIYSSVDRWEEGNSLRRRMSGFGYRKTPGISRIQVDDGQVHQFTAGDMSHPRTSEIYSILHEVHEHIRLAGYSPDASAQVSCLLERGNGLEEQEEEREQTLLYHSERLAIAFGLVSTRAGSMLRVYKNLRICRDCHTAVKFISELYRRDIVVRDRNRFHYFKHGKCSCSDYW